MDLNTENLQVSDHFLDFALANIRKKKLIECLHTGRVMALTASKRLLPSATY